MKKESKKAFLKFVLNIYQIFGIIFCIVALALIITPIIPNIWYTLNPSSSDNELVSLTQDIKKDATTFEDIHQTQKFPSELIIHQITPM